MINRSLNRRKFLGAAAVGGLTVAGATTLTACGGAAGGSSTGGAKASAGLKLPAYVPAQVATPELAGNAEGLDAGYLRYPKKLVASVKGKPGDGKPITALTETFTTPAPAMGKNGYWQELNKRLGSRFDMTIVQDIGDGYPGKFNAIIASDEIPDLVWFPPNQGLQKVPQLLDAKFHDLTPYLSGDKVKDYPNLANLPEYAWKTAVVNGKIRGVAVAYGRMGQVYVANEDFWKPVGGLKFDSAQDFLDKGKELLDTKRQRYVLEPAYVNHLGMFGQWFGAPNGWRVDGGKLVHEYETDEYKAALEFAVKVAKAKLFWPDSNLSTTMEKVSNGQIGAYVQSFPSFLVDMKSYDFPFGVIEPFAAVDGAEPRYDFGYGSVGYTAIAGSVPKDRIPTMLKVLDYLSAPFGTEERLFLENGVEGVHFERSKDGDVTPTEKGKAEALTTAMPLTFLANSPQYLYLPGKAELTRKVHGVAERLVKIGQANPTTGLFSDASTEKGASIGSTWNDWVTSVVVGRKSLSEYDAQLKKWRSGGGDQMRKEFEKALADSK